MQRQESQRIQQQMCEEQLQRTQVINLDDFKKTAKIEKMSSKKPAIVIALLGIFSILIGASYPAVNSKMRQKKDVTKTSKTQTRKVVKENKTYVKCSVSALNQPDGTDAFIDINYTFEDDKLISFIKEYKLVLTNGVTTGQAVIDGFLQALPPYLVQQPGYELTVKKLDTGISTTTKVDYKTLDVNKIPQLNQENFRFNVIYVANSTKDAVIKDMQQQNYTCVEQ